MKAKKTKLAALLLAGAMLLSEAGCSGNGNSSSQDAAGGESSQASSNTETSEVAEEGPKEEVTITFMTNVGSTTDDKIKPLVSSIH